MVVINIAREIAFGLIPYWVENINAINPTGAEATIIVVSDISKLISCIVQIINIASNGWSNILKIIIKLEIFFCVFSIWWAKIILAANNAQGAADNDMKFIDLLIDNGNFISK